MFTVLGQIMQIYSQGGKVAEGFWLWDPFYQLVFHFQFHVRLRQYESRRPWVIQLYHGSLVDWALKNNYLSIYPGLILS